LTLESDSGRLLESGFDDTQRAIGLDQLESGGRSEGVGASTGSSKVVIVTNYRCITISISNMFLEWAHRRLTFVCDIDGFSGSQNVGSVSDVLGGHLWNVTDTNTGEGRGCTRISRDCPGLCGSPGGESSARVLEEVQCLVTGVREGCDDLQVADISNGSRGL